MTAQIAPSAAVKATAEALRRLRMRAGPDGRGVSQEQAATAIGQRKQSWQAYEAGQRQVILRSDVQDRLTRALGFTPEDLEREKAQVLSEPADGGRSSDAAPDQARPAAATGAARSAPTASLQVPVWGRGRGGLRGAHIYDVTEPERWLDLASLYGPSSRAMQLIGDSMYPWASSGTTIVYDLDRWPRREQGCVVETRSQGYYVKLFDHTDGEKLYVRELQPEERIVEFDLSDVVGVYAVQDRIDR
ncbi:MAG: helix-turn-helix domain-containing protein [Phenylobacterium sp.]|uniref:helix-turn-helix domain-containing protein n=1 Tax=Phenylobacterium sp. TaxID=1871053 RepID=UPI0027363E3D|nr:helix-turn-helix domain-containing protein [Phenylobacterium sp.]MDP1642745.1 helix-turn-helix domain-containing protein [Phenylobacterium sp.]MDP3117207.1 helix-turn-helix domain-containing protein [Phenylobacterium sp.]